MQKVKLIIIKEILKSRLSIENIHVSKSQISFQIMHDSKSQFKFHFTHDFESKASKTLTFFQKITNFSKNFFLNMSQQQFSLLISHSLN